MTDWVIQVDPEDQPLGTVEKLAAHQQGILHRAVSVFLLDSQGRLLLQRRATGKYHSGGLWSNTCCGHPGPGESVAQAARRRLREELGIEAELSPLLRFQYRAELEGGLTEHELDHVFLGRFDGIPHPDPNEVSAWSWNSPSDLEAAMASSPAEYTVWLRLLLPAVRGCLRSEPNSP